MQVAQLAQWLERDKTIRILDVRTPAEFESSHIEGSYNVPLDTLREHATELAQIHGPVVLVCRSGQRAGQADTRLREAGMKDLYVLDGGLQSWQAHGGRIVQAQRQKLSLERQVRIAVGLLSSLGAVLALTVHPGFAALSLFVGSGLMFAGATDWCGMALLLSRLPYNGGRSCDVSDAIAALKKGS